MKIHIRTALSSETGTNKGERDTYYSQDLGDVGKSGPSDI